MTRTYTTTLGTVVLTLHMGENGSIEASASSGDNGLVVNGIPVQIYRGYNVKTGLSLRRKGGHSWRLDDRRRDVTCNMLCNIDEVVEALVLNAAHDSALIYGPGGLLVEEAKRLEHEANARLDAAEKALADAQVARQVAAANAIEAESWSQAWSLGQIEDWKLGV